MYFSEKRYTSPAKTLNKINHIIQNEHIDLIVGHSLGGFFAAASLYEVPKILINPCLNPHLELPSVSWMMYRMKYWKSLKR
ncbi:YqiA/YcfP family alpha/beta fold hydrolase [Treponema phagedenis]|uniref:YqiA/YcfP family alpha/beta fold hydrolase n=1 Tax=Treponema phagedenis TaxID=162 RepID=UPI0009DF8EB8|nr:hypothetical protein FUT79_03160 [Treponema phagedenis]QEK02203.1 hypothetical protein FUT84_03130 [Treponema phagedenis]QEK07957.1 hypothetical protein FUT80_14225 [Treponema phagedenis]QSH95701.1 hypothetical protein C5O78_11905 [Treponema phagedenis]